MVKLNFNLKSINESIDKEPVKIFDSVADSIARACPKSTTILIVDDEPANIKLLQRLLHKDGYTKIITTQNPDEVLSLYQQYEIELILLDLNMPVIDGFEVMEQLKKNFEDDLAPILVLTAQHLQGFRQRALDCGALDYVTKPFDRQELLSRVRNLLEIQLARKYMRSQNDALERRVMYRTYELEIAHQQLYDSRLQIVQRLGRAAEYRDNETGLHIIRMSQISARLGEEVGMSREQCALLLNASPMHDIGKIGIPDKILLKPGKFEPDEWTVMKTHSQIGADILAGGDSELLIMASEIALTHHEKWDGSGYPHGLKDQKIPLVGRIVAIADVFDALVSARPYKKAWSIDEAVATINEGSGKHFDPELVTNFMQILPDVILINKKYAEPENE